MAIKSIRKPLIILTTVTALATGVGGYVWKEENRPALLEVYIFSVKGGQSTFIRTPDDKRILINSGSNSEIVRHITKVLPFYSQRIDAVIVTNDTDTNVTGLVDVVNRYRVDRLFVPAITPKSLKLASSTSRIYSELLKSARAKGIPIQEIMAGDSLPVSSKVKFDALFPVEAESFTYSRASAPELVLRIAYGTTSIIFLGNTSKKVQKYISAQGFEQTDVAVFSHNAGSNNISSELLDVLKPDYFIYSGSVAKVWHNSDAKQINLKDTGIIKITSDGVKIDVIQGL